MFEQNIEKPSEKPSEKFPNIDPNIAKYLEKIDFETLRNIFSKKIESVGVDPQKNIGRFVKNEGKFKNNPSSALASYNHFNGKIAINNNKFIRFSNDLSRYRDEDHIKKEYILYLLCHEETHAVGFKNMCIGAGFSVLNSGYSETEKVFKQTSDVTQKLMYSTFNEAVTEFIASQVFVEYLQEKREGYDEAVFNYANPHNELLIPMLSEIVKKICQECDLEETVMEKVIMRGYFAGEDLSGDKMNRLFKNIFPQNFEKELAAWELKGNFEDNKKIFTNIINLIQRSVWTDNDKKRIRRWVMSVYQLMPASQDK